MSGRKNQAARNDELILRAAREVLIDDPEAPMSAVGERAGVGMSALYRRYRSKDELLQQLSLVGLQRYIAAAEAALTDRGSAWSAFVKFMQGALDAGTGSLTVRFAGRFRAGDQLQAEARRAYAVTKRLLERTRAAGAIRPDIGVADISLLFELLQGVRLKDARRAAQIRHRYLALLLDALHRPGVPLPGAAPRWLEISGRY